MSVHQRWLARRLAENDLLPIASQSCGDGAEIIAASFNGMPGSCLKALFNQWRPRCRSDDDIRALRAVQRQLQSKTPEYAPAADPAPLPVLLADSDRQVVADKWQPAVTSARRKSDFALFRAAYQCGNPSRLDAVTLSSNATFAPVSTRVA